MVSQNAINRSSDTLYVTTLDTNVAAAGVTLTATTLSTDGTDANIPLVCNGKGTGPLQTTKIGIGTATVPHGGEGFALFAMHGGTAVATAPIVQWTTTDDDKPIAQFTPLTHDNITLHFDNYNNGTNSISTDAGSNFAINKNSDVLSMKYDSGVAVDGVIAWNFGLSLSATGEVTKPNQPCVIAYNSAQDDNVTGNATNFTIIFDTEIKDQGGDFDGASTFTAPVTGSYQINVTVLLLGAAAATDGNMYIVTSNRTYSGNRWAWGSFDNGGTAGQTISQLVDMDAADTLTASVMANGVGADSVDVAGGTTNTVLSIFLAC